MLLVDAEAPSVVVTSIAEVDLGGGPYGQLGGSEGSFLGSELSFVFLVVVRLHHLSPYGSQPLLSLASHRLRHCFCTAFASLDFGFRVLRNAKGAKPYRVGFKGITTSAIHTRSNGLLFLPPLQSTMVNRSGMVEILSFHPNNQDIVYFKFNEHIVMSNLREGMLESEIAAKTPYDSCSWGEAYAFALP
ncbi:hypothetical protein D8674_002737 [Pyrus ussuriensis x Pyrus communis]|uniref:Uncharacterized protein n=1 Tax=Pyrus ussuriensis x Pyrus communis TaxID=2448454 RepID=A0A5N5FKJ7_9ROSA|nr:hypothetical protein D8674_002737 [Pyrus ussuriensis x Pyrus communis]